MMTLFKANIMSYSKTKYTFRKKIKYVYKDYNKYPDSCYSEISTKHHVLVHVVQMIPMAPC